MNYYYLPNGGPGWRVNSFGTSGIQWVVNIEIGYEGETSFTDYFFAYSISSEAEAESAILSLPTFSTSTGPITGGGFPKR
jgi:hypothetical protein